jgi:hypothetical protein
MAHFYGTLQGNRGEASRLGTPNSGLDVTAASWQGAISVRLYARGDVDCATIRMRKWHGSGEDKLIYDGPVGAFDPASLHGGVEALITANGG